MRQILFTTILVLGFSIVGFGQVPTTRAERRSETVIMTNNDFEKLDIAASIDRFGKLSDDQKKFHLDLFSGIISDKNQTIEYVIQLKGNTPKDVSQNMEFIYLYLTENKKISPSRISFALSSESANDTELWLIPNKNISIPGCTDCVIISGEDEKKLKEFFQIKKSKKSK